MGRRTILLITALVVAALGTVLVFLYVQSADDRAAEGQAQVEVLFATQEIPVGQTSESASANGAFELRTVAQNSVADGAISSIDPIAGQVALVDGLPGPADRHRWLGPRVWRVSDPDPGRQDGAVVAAR